MMSEEKSLKITKINMKIPRRSFRVFSSPQTLDFQVLHTLCKLNILPTTSRNTNISRES